MNEIIVLFFTWIAIGVPQGADAIIQHEAFSEKFHAAQESCYHDYGKDAIFASYRSVIRKYRFEWKGLSTILYSSGYDFICFKIEEKKIEEFE